MRVYLDNMIACGRIVPDLAEPAEQDAVREIEAAMAAGKLKRVTSVESWREQARTVDSGKRGRFEESRGEVSVISSDHALLGNVGPLLVFDGTTVKPFAPDTSALELFEDLRRIGLKDADARHLMNGIRGDDVRGPCDVLLTTDRDFLDRRAALAARCPSIRILKPSELVAEISAPA